MLKTLIALTSLSLVATPAFAVSGTGAGQSAPTARVSHADLNLARPADRRLLDRRIAAAVNKVCPPLTQPGRVTKSGAGLRCHAETTALAQPQRTAAVTRASAATVTADSR